MDLIEVPAGEVLFRKGDMSDTAYLVQSGVVEVFDEGKEQGDETHIKLLTQGMMFGEYGVLDQVPRTASIRIVADAVLRRMPLQPHAQ